MVLVSVMALGPAGRAHARDIISIVGSSTVYPFATVVAERFGRWTGFKSPRIEATGTGGGFKLFCKGLGALTPDITNASRRIKPSELADCRRNGVGRIVEVPIGFDGIVVAHAREAAPLRLTLRELFLALAKDVPGADGRLVPNPHRRWRDIDPALPPARIEVFGPPPTSGTRDAFAELALGGGAREVPELARLPGLGADRPDAILAAMAGLGIPEGIYRALRDRTGAPPSGEDLFRSIAFAVREDGAYIEAGENDNLIVQKLQANPDALGILGFGFVEENPDKVRGCMIDGVEPGFDTIASGDYPISRPLYIYLKAAHVGRIPGLLEYTLEFISDRAMGDYGYLSERGLVPLPPDGRERVQAVVRDLVPVEQ